MKLFIGLTDGTMIIRNAADIQVIHNTSEAISIVYNADPLRCESYLLEEISMLLILK